MIQDTIAVFRRANKAAFEAAFLQVLLLARETGLLRVGTVSIEVDQARRQGLEDMLGAP